MSWLKHLVEDFKAWRRGEERIAPRGTRGRVYRKKGQAGDSSGSDRRVKTRGTTDLDITVTRKDGSIEKYSASGTV